MLDEYPIGSAEAARVLGVSKGTMRVWRTRGTGPPCHYSGTKPVYYTSELHAWQAVCTAAMRQKQSERAAVAAIESRKRSSNRLIGGRSEAANA